MWREAHNMIRSSRVLTLALPRIVFPQPLPGTQTDSMMHRFVDICVLGCFATVAFMPLIDGMCPRKLAFPEMENYYFGVFHLFTAGLLIFEAMFKPRSSTPKTSTGAATGSSGPPASKKRAPPSPKLVKGFASQTQTKMARTKSGSSSVGECQVVINPHTSQGTRVHPKLQNTTTTQVQVQDRPGRPNLFYNINEAFPAFLHYRKNQLTQIAEADPQNQDKRGTAEGFPITLPAMENLGIILRVTGGADYDKVGFQQWRIAFYADDGMDGLNNLMLLLDAFFMYKMATPDFATRRNPVIQVFNNTTMFLEQFRNEKTYNGYDIDPAASAVHDPTMHVFGAYPPDRVQVPIGSIHLTSEDSAAITFRGAMYAFSDDLKAHGLGGDYFNATGDACEKDDDGAVFHRILGDIDFSEDAAKQRFYDTLGDAGFQDSPICFLVTDEEAHSGDGAVKGILDDLRGNPRYRILAAECDDEQRP